MIDRSCSIYRLIAGLCLFGAGCSHRQSSVVTTAPPAKVSAPQMLAVVPTPSHVFTGSGVQFDYPAGWQPTQGQTCVFSVTRPTESAGLMGRPSFTLDVPKLPWHIPGMISVAMVCSGYVDDLRKNQIPDAAIQEQCPMIVGGEKAKRITCAGHTKGKPSTDVAVILVHADRVYIFSADSDGTDCDCARKTLDAAVASIKWTK